MPDRNILLAFALLFFAGAAAAAERRSLEFAPPSLSFPSLSLQSDSSPKGTLIFPTLAGADAMIESWVRRTKLVSSVAPVQRMFKLKDEIIPLASADEKMIVVPPRARDRRMVIDPQDLLSR